MPAEWQARQLLLATCELGPSGNMRSPLGSSTLTDFSINLSSACAHNGANATPAMRAIGSSLRVMFSSSGDHDLGLLDDIPHKAARIPIGRVGLRLAFGAGAPDHQ